MAYVGYRLCSRYLGGHNRRCLHYARSLGSCFLAFEFFATTWLQFVLAVTVDMANQERLFTLVALRHTGSTKLRSVSMSLIDLGTVTIRQVCGSSVLAKFFESKIIRSYNEIKCHIQAGQDVRGFGQICQATCTAELAGYQHGWSHLVIRVGRKDLL